VYGPFQRLCLGTLRGFLRKVRDVELLEVQVAEQLDVVGELILMSQYKYENSGRLVLVENQQLLDVMMAEKAVQMEQRNLKDFWLQQCAGWQ